MTVQTSASLIDLDALMAAARAVAFQFGALGDVEARALAPQERSGQFDGGVVLSVRTGGVSPGLVGLVAGADAAATVVGEGDLLGRWEPLMAQIIVTLSSSVGDLEPQNVQILAPGAGNGPAMDPEAISIGLFLEGKLLAAVGFVAGPEAQPAPAPTLASVPAAAPAPAPQVFQPLSGGDVEAAQARRMHLLRDVEMGVSVELGRTRMTVRELLALAPGAIVELDKAAGAPVDLLVNGTLMAHGEVVVIDEEFAIRISEIVTTELMERRKS